jgi:hypothetical protein
MHAVGTPFITGPVDKTSGLNDGLLAEETESGESLLVATLDRDLLEMSRVRPEAPGLALRRPELYERLRSTGRP